jgi:hypothetical protein
MHSFLIVENSYWNEGSDPKIKNKNKIKGSDQRHSRGGERLESYSE